nr:immunoglobulin heavy chain junction region [Macaca mulatta]
CARQTPDYGNYEPPNRFDVW